jgi:tetratricopeptide (TPR) repeat protein/tRNA A-37 threonylcarbamoyl transferase component Bud32
VSTSAGRPASGSAANPALDRLIEAMTEKLQAGEPVDLEGFLGQHPEHTEQVRRLLPALEVLAALGRSAARGMPLGPVLGPESGVLGDFRILREVGRGGMGVAYEAEQVSFGRRVALKVLPFAAALDPRQLQRFRVEAQAAAQLHHTNIVPVFSVGVERGVHYYAMQFIDGRSLAEVIHELRQSRVGSEPSDRSPLGPSAPGRPFFEAVARLGGQAAEALENAHSLGVIHRDVKPANLLLDARGTLWVTDFGLARFHADAGLTMTGDVLGTLRYMSPEQALAKRVLVDQRTDVYSLGVTLYEMLTLRPAFDGRDRQELLRQIAFEEPPLPRRHNPAVPRELETVVLKAMAKEPVDRYTTAEELADDLRRFLEHRPIRARRPTLRERVVKWSRRHTAAAGAAFIVLLTVAAALLASTLLVAREQGRTAAALKLAESRSRQARKAVDAMYTRVAQTWLARQPKMRPLQREFLEEALAFYEDFARDQGTDPEARHAMALAQRRVGDIQADLGRHAQAGAAFRRSIDVLDRLSVERPGAAEHREELVNSLLSLARLYDVDGRIREAADLNRRALLLQEALVTQFPERVDYRGRQARCILGLGNVLYDAGQIAEAERAYRQSKAMCEALLADPRGRVEGLQGVRRAYHNLGMLYHHTGQLVEAERECRLALDVDQQLLAADPTSFEWRHHYASDLEGLAERLKQLGRWDEARGLLLQAIELQERLVSDDPDFTFHSADLALSLYQLAEVLHHDGRRDEAEPALRRSIALLDELIAATPASIMLRLFLAKALKDLAVIERERGRFDDARKRLASARMHVQAGLKINPRHPELRQAAAEIEPLEKQEDLNEPGGARR